MRKQILGLTLLWAGSLYAQDSLRTVRLEELAITAIRATASSPTTHSTINRQEFQSINFGQDGSLLIEALSPSIITYSDAGTAFGNYNQFRLRGIDQSRVNITLNGTPLNDMIDQGVYFSNFSDFSSSIESVQVQRGIGVSSNGTASYAGSVGYESLDLTNAKTFYGGSFTGGSFGSLRLQTEAFTGLNDKGMSTYLRASKLNSDGYKYNSGSDAHSFFLSTGKRFDKSFLNLTAFSGRSQNQQSYAYILLEDINADPRTNAFPKADQDDFKQELVQLQYSYEVNASTGLSVTGYYGGARGYFPYTAGVQYIYSLQNDHYGGLVNLSKVYSSGKLSAGLHFYQFDRANESAVSGALDEPYYSDATQKNEFSGFLKLEQDLGQLTLFADAQVRNVDLIFESDTLAKYYGSRTSTRKETFLNPRIGVTYHLNNRSNVYASFGRTGREPTRTDLMQGAFDGVESWNYTAFTDKSVVKSEFVNDLEAGYRYNGDKLKFLVNAFYMSFENEISQVGGLVQNSYFVLRQNVKSSQRMGMELDASYKLNQGMKLGLIATVMSTNVDAFDTGTEVLKNVQHVFAPRSMFQPSIGWSNERISTSLDARIVSRSFMELSNDANYILPAYQVLNFSTGWKATEMISLSFKVNNLLDKLYFTDGGPVDIDYDGTPEGPGYRVQAPRNFLASLSVKF